MQINNYFCRSKRTEWLNSFNDFFRSFDQYKYYRILRIISVARAIAIWTDIIRQYPRQLVISFLTSFLPVSLSLILLLGYALLVLSSSQTWKKNHSFFSSKLIKNSYTISFFQLYNEKFIILSFHYTNK